MSTAFERYKNRWAEREKLPIRPLEDGRKSRRGIKLPFRPRKVTLEQVEEIMKINGKKSSIQVGRMFGLDHSTILYYWKRANLRSPFTGGGAPIKNINAHSVSPRQVRLARTGYSDYKKILERYENKIFVRDEIGNLVKVVPKHKALSTPSPNVI